MTAICCWCQRPLAKEAATGLWWCPSEGCQDRQREHGIGVSERKTKRFQWLYLPTPKQVEFDACRAKYVLYGGAAGPGKSHAVRWALYRRSLRIKNFRALLLRRTYGELESTHLDKMQQEAESVGAVFTKSERTMAFPATGALIRCGHMDDRVALSRYLSTEYDVIAPEEGSTYEPVDLLELSTRARSSNPQVIAEGGAKFWVPSNPGGPSSATLLDFFIDHRPDTDLYPAMATDYDPSEWAYIPATLDDNPYIDPAYERQLATTTKWRYEQLRYGDWRVFAGQFFSQWNERQHVASLEPSREARWFRSLDWGRNQPGCVLWWAQLPDHKLFIRREFKFQGMSEQEVAHEIKTIDRELGLRKVAYTAGDPSMKNKTGATHKDGTFVGQAIAETLGYYGVPIVGADHDRFNGWSRCHALLRDAPDKTPWLQVHPDCRYLVRSIAGATSDKNDPDDVDTKSDDHALDAWRYGAMSRPHPAIASTAKPKFAPGTMGWLRTQGQAVVNRLGSESRRAS